MGLEKYSPFTEEGRGNIARNPVSNAPARAWDNAFGTGKDHDIRKKGAQGAEDYYKSTQPLNEAMNQADTTYGAAAKSSMQGGLLANATLSREADGQAGDARQTYKNTIQPRLKASMEDAYKEQAGAMTLSQAGDVNNATHKGVRDLYQKQAMGAQRQGMQDFGVMSALGAQAAGGQFGAPMTQGQQANIYAANQGQAGEAYGRAQQRMHGLQQQGLDRGFEESDRQYQRGQGAKDRYRESLGDITGAESQFHEGQRGFRGERQGYTDRRMGMQQGMAGLDRDAIYGKSERELQASGAKYGQLQQINTNQQANNQATQNGYMQAGGTLAGAAATAYAGKK